MAKQLNVDMRFTADTSKAKQQITELQQAIQKLGYGVAPKDIINPAQFEQASAAARELAYHLNNAYNTKTGNLDLSRLNASLKASGTDLGKLTANFKNAGEVGQQAFVSLARSIAMADQPTISVNTHLATMFTTLKNVARFQISSSIMHGLIGGIQTAYGYAQDLNESLNNIRIVTGQSTEQMARFAQEANKTARSLSATTLDYTNASLIYYQQGLDDEAVRQRTDVTIKMANVARESAETVSEQLTAIWNNFDDGSKSLEYYADVITALGAATASSSSEISAGLNKFAAVADTVGLSYENATAALATITATTRQSADTVGTGLRTLFSRLQGLSLGETLEDGVNLNKYSEALAKVGVQALDSSGNLRRMDEVLEDLGARWDTLTKAQQTALAQTVGGVRQYTTLVALMDNWDFMKQNQQVAAGAEGTLQNQADIYAESWEAARDRVKAAVESLYDTLIDENFFIGVDKVIEHVLVGVNKFLEGFGGIKSLLISVLSFTLSMAANKIGPAFQKIIQDIQIITGGADKVYAKMQTKTNAIIDAELSAKDSSGNSLYNTENRAVLEGSKSLLAVKTKLGLVENQLSEAEKMRAEIAIGGIQRQIKANEELGKEIDSLRTKQEELNRQYELDIKTTEKEKIQNQENLEIESQKAVKNNIYDAYRGSFFKYGVEIDQDSVTNLQAAREEALQIGNTLRQGLVTAFVEGKTEAASFNSILNQAITKIGNGDFYKFEMAGSLEEAKAKIDILKSSFGELIEISPELKASFEQALNADSGDKFNAGVQKIIQNLTTLKEQGIDVEEALEKMNISPKTLQSFKTLQQELEQLKNEEKQIERILAGEEASELSLSDAGKKRLQIAEQIKKKEEEIKRAIEQTNQSANNFNIAHTITPTEGIAKAAAGFGQVAMLMNSIKGAYKTLGDESATTGEKITASFMAISMSVPAITGAFKSFTTASKMFQNSTIAASIANKLFGTSLLEAKNTITIAENAEMALNKVRGTDSITSTYSLLSAQRLLTAAKIEDADGTLAAAIIEEMKTGVSFKEAIQNLITKGTIDQDSGARLLNVKAIQQQIIANKLFKASMIEFILIAAAVALAIFGIVKAIQAWQANTPEGQLKTANKELEESKKIADEAKQAYEDLLSTISNYTSAHEALENLTAGTSQFAEQLLKANEYARQLIQTLGLTEGNGFTIDENGAFIINTNSQEFKDKQREQYQKMTEAEQQEMLDRWEVQAKERELNQEKFNNRYNPNQREAIKQMAETGTVSDSIKQEYIKNMANDLQLYNDYSQADALTEAQSQWGQFNEHTLQNQSVLSDYQRLFGTTGDILAYNSQANDLKAQLVSNLGYDEAFLEAQKNGLAGGLLANLTEDQINSVLTAVDKKGAIADLQTFISDKAASYNEQIENAKEAGNEDLVKATLNGKLSEYLSTLSLDELKNLQNFYTGYASFGIKDWQEALELNGSSFQEAINNVITNWAPTAFDTSGLEQSYADITKITDKLKTGDTIKEADYNTLGDVAEGYFTKMADGTYMLTTEAETFQKAVKEVQIEKLAEGLSRVKNGLDKAEDIWNNNTPFKDTSLKDQTEIIQTRLETNENLSFSTNKQSSISKAYIQAMLGEEGISQWNETTAEEERIDLLQQAVDSYNSLIESMNNCETEIATMATTTEELAKYTRDNNLSNEAWGNGLITIAAQYEECYDEITEYNKAIKDYGKGSKEAQAAQQKLWKAIRNQEWGKLVNDISDYVKTLNNSASSAFEIKKANQEIAKSFNKTFNTDITEDWVDDNKELFQEWANASEEEANDVAEKILDLAKMDSIANMDPIDLNDKFKLPEGTFNGLQEKWQNVKSILEANPITVDAYGNADMSNLVASLLEAEYSAEEVAGILAAIGQTDVSLNGFDTGTLAHYDLTTQEGIEGFIKGLQSWHGKIDTASGQYPTVGGGSAEADMTKIGGSKGGGGGGSNKKTHEQKKRDGGDRYRPIKAKQEDKSRQIDQAREKAERLAGKARIDNLKEENKLLGDNIKLQQQYIDEINNYLAQDKNDMLSKFDDFGISLNFDENGVINNYDSIMDRMYAIYNEKANQELDEDTWKEFEEGWQAAIDALEQYVETRDLAEEETANLTDMINEQFDQLLEMTATKLELDIQVNDQDLEFLDYLLNKIDDDAYKAAEAIALMGDKAARELERANYYQNAINQTLATYGIDSMEQLANMSPEELQNLGITQDTIDNLIDWNSELLDTASTLDELQSEILDKVISGFDDLNEKVQDSYDYFSHWNTVLENYRDIVDLNMSALGGKQARDLIKTIDNSMLKNSVNALRSSKQIYDDLVKSRAEAEAKLQEAVAAGRIGDIQRYEDVLADIDEKIKDSQEQWLSDWSDGLQKAQDILTRAVEDAVAEYDKLLSPVYGSLDYLSEAYDRGKEVDEDYVQDYEKLYQLNKLNRDLTKVLGDTDGLKNKEQLIKLQEKINKLQKDNTKMSEYDLEVLRKEFEVQQARIALEEAANAKSTVRLQRDNEGNWGYVYTSDFDSTEELQQSYEDKLHEYQQLNDEYMSEMSDKLMELSQDARDRISEIWSDATLTQEEKEARVAEVMKWFNAQRDYIEEQMGHAIDNQAALTDRFYQTYQNMQAQVRDTFAETVLSQTTNIAQLSEMTGLLTTGVANLVESGRLASLEYLASMEEINEAAGSTMQDLADNITNATHEIDIASNANVETISELSEVVQEELLNALDSAIEQEERLAASIASTTDAIEAQTAALNNMLRVLNNTAGSSIDINNNPLDTLSQSSEKYGINQPSYNENDWILNHNMTDIFDALYDEEKWNISHEDFLDMYSAIQDWMNILSTQTISAMQGFGSIMSPYYQTPEADELEQNVHIEANFPGVTDSSAIEEAFENLVNKAAQFANRKRQG